MSTIREFFAEQPSVPQVVNPLVVLIRSEPGMAERLLVEHADDGSGRCRVCTAGSQTGRLTWPCQTQMAAAAAADTAHNPAAHQ
jgi:hypothetical protein